MTFPLIDKPRQTRQTSRMARFSIETLKLPDFRRLMLTRSFALMALQAQAVIVGWQVYSITRDPFMLGLTGLVEAVPAIASALFAGHIVDNSRPHRIYHLCLGVLALNTLMLWLFAGGVVHLPGGHVLIILYGGVFISGMARAFIMPSSFSLLPQIVPRAQISAAAAWLSAGLEIATIGGPSIAGLIFAFQGAEIAWLMPVILLFVSFAIFAGMTAKTKQYKSDSLREPAMKSIAAGWRYILQNPALLSVMALDMFAVLFGGAVAMLPAYADQVLHVGAEGLGFLRAAPAIGAVGMALYLATHPFKSIKATTLLVAVTGFGLSIIGFGLSEVFWLSAVFLAMTGMFDAISVVIRSTLVQLLTTDAVRGRVSSVNSMFIISSNELGAFESGLAARTLGLVPSVVFGGAMTLVVAALTASLSKKFRRTVIHTESPVP
jgi:MFS family permease